MIASSAMIPLSYFVFLPLFSSLIFAQTQDSALFPSSYPLAVRSPYLQCWEASTNGTHPTTDWPLFWNTGILGWAGHIRIDGRVYRWLGNDGSSPSTPVNLTSRQVTPTRTIFTMQAGPMNLNVTFLSPIEPSDWVRQSLPFSYVTIEATSADDLSHDVQVYSDVTGEWLSQNRSNVMTWRANPNSGYIYLQSQLATSFPLSADATLDQANDGTLYYAMQTRSNMTYQIGPPDCRVQFFNNGTLLNTVDQSFRAISDNFPVMAISVDLGSITTTSSPVTWAIGYVRDPVINYTTANGDKQLRSPYFRTQYATDAEAINDFLIDYDSASARASALDDAVMQKATSISTQYADLVSLAARQAFGGIEISVSNGTDGQLNTSDVKIFMKDIGTSRRVNPVEVLYAAFPMFLYFNASFGGPLLSPLLEYQDSSNYTQPFAAQDLGTEYPLALGDSDDHQQGVEQSGNMLIMTLAHARFSGDGSLITQHYDLLKKWADYLVNNSLTPTAQVTADSQSNPNMTNLAFKGLVGIQAMSQISKVLNHSSDAEEYAEYVTANINVWQDLALSSNRDHFLFSYGEESSSALMYNLFADRLLGTNLIPQSIYQSQTEFYQSQMSSSPHFGLPIDSDIGTQGNAAWLLFTAATATDPAVRNQLISFAWLHASSNLTQGPFPTSYDVSSGKLSSSQSIANPAQGAIFAPLALNSLRNQSITVSQSQPSSSQTPEVKGFPGRPKHKSDVAAIVGGVVAGIVALVIAVLVVVFVRRRRSRASLERRGITQPDPFLDAFPTSQSPLIQRGAISFKVSSSPLTLENTRTLVKDTNATVTQLSVPNTFRTQASSPVQEPFISPSDVANLRTEMENLRRAMQGIGVETSEPPPTYIG